MNNFPKIIGFAGLAGSGKSTMTKLVRQQGVHREVNFADPLKDTVCDLFDYQIEDIDGKTPASREFREKIDERYGKTPRQIMQEVGESMRNVYPNVWVDVWRSYASVFLKEGSLGVVVGDVRHINEMEAIKALGGEVWMVVRGDPPEWLMKMQREGHVAGVLWDIDGKTPIHKSEWEQFTDKALNLLDSAVFNVEGHSEDSLGKAAHTRDVRVRTNELIASIHVDVERATGVKL